MRRVLCIWLFALATVLVVACGSANNQEIVVEEKASAETVTSAETTTSELETLVDTMLMPSGNEPTNMTVTFLVAEGDIDYDEVVFYHTPDIIYTTTGSENGLGGTFMYIQGAVKSFETQGDNELVIIQSSSGIIGLTLHRELFVAEYIELDLLEIGEYFDVFFMYMGMSSVLEMPVGMFVGLCLNDIYIPAPTPTPEPTPEPIPLPDFFDDEERASQFDQFMRAGSFADIYYLTIYYIENNNPHEQDSAWEIINLLEPILEHINRVTIIHDTFNNTATIFYRGLYDVSLQHSFVPYTGTRSSGLSIMVGFHNNGWIFADRARIRLEDGSTVTVTMGRDSTRDVIRGGEIREFVRFNPNSRQLEQLLCSRPYMIRFEESERQLDRTLTELEQNALDVIHLFERSQVPLRRLFNTRGRTYSQPTMKPE